MDTGGRQAAAKALQRRRKENPRLPKSPRKAFLSKLSLSLSLSLSMRQYVYLHIRRRIFYLVNCFSCAESPAEFFSENKNIAGFDYPWKSLYTTVRELVENSLDSAESISELPVVEIIM
ncbi:uncharacterized protein LOC120016202 isoform X2 [Tripterygium wilfordii]|nr:uncharacterized protein LOC120016202 isoform X2 [Tripterygium wilfordii]